MKINENSYIVRLAKCGGLDYYRGQTDLCSLVRHLMVGLALLSSIIMLLSVLGAHVIVGLWQIYIKFTTGLPMTPVGVIISSILVAAVMCSVMFACIFMHVNHGWFERKHKKQTKPSLVGQLYDSWKNKYCPIIEVTYD